MVSTAKLLSSQYAALIGCSRRHLGAVGTLWLGDPHPPYGGCPVERSVDTRADSADSQHPTPPLAARSELASYNPFFLVTKYSPVVVAMDDRRHLGCSLTPNHPLATRWLLSSRFFWLPLGTEGPGEPKQVTRKLVVPSRAWGTHGERLLKHDVGGRHDRLWFPA